MKFTALILMASLLIEPLAPCISYASGQLEAETLNRGVKPDMVQDRATVIAERAIRSLYGLDVRTMSRGRLDVSKLNTGLFAHVVHASGGSKRSSTGTIVQIAHDGIALWVAERPAEREKIPYVEIDTLVVAAAGNSRALERWQRRAEGRFLVMSRSNLDLAKLNKGWYALVVYRVGDGTRVELTEIRDTKEDKVVFGPRYTTSGQFWRKREIARDKIEIIVAAEYQNDITDWRHATRVIPHLIENPKFRFKTPGTTSGKSKAKTVTGRLIDVNRDSFVVSAGLSSRDVFRLPLSSFTDFETNLGRRRNAGKGFLIGGGLVFYGWIIIGAAAAKGGSKPNPGSRTFPELGGLLLLVLSATIGTTIGYFVETDRWVDWDKLSPPRLNLNRTPSQSRGFGAALTFNF